MRIDVSEAGWKGGRPVCRIELIGDGTPGTIQFEDGLEPELLAHYREWVEGAFVQPEGRWREPGGVISDGQVLVDVTRTPSAARWTMLHALNVVPSHCRHADLDARPRFDDSNEKDVELKRELLDYYARRKQVVQAQTADPALVQQAVEFQRQRSAERPPLILDGELIKRSHRPWTPNPPGPPSSGTFVRTGGRPRTPEERAAVYEAERLARGTQSEPSSS